MSAGMRFFTAATVYASSAPIPERKVVDPMAIDFVLTGQTGVRHGEREFDFLCNKFFSIRLCIYLGPFFFCNKNITGCTAWCGSVSPTFPAPLIAILLTTTRNRILTWS